MRLDVYMATNSFASSREKAVFLIKNGNVSVNGRVIVKSSYDVKDGDEVSVFNTLIYVGKGGLKLEKAFNVFAVSASQKTVLDVGASTGGFTDCSLRRGAKKVYAVDVGHGQLDKTLLNDIRVKNYEGINITELDGSATDRCELVTVDVSFVSLTYILPCLERFLADKADIICLVKPQFEVGRANVKNGIVRDKKLHRSAIVGITGFASECGYAVAGLDYSPICGGDGNIEFLLHLRNYGSSSIYDIDKTVEEAHSALKRA